MRIKVITGCAGDNYAFGKGGEYDTTEEIAADLIKAGFAVRLDVETEKAVIKPTEKAKKK